MNYKDFVSVEENNIETTFPICPICDSKLKYSKCNGDTVHYARLDCPNCNKWIRWMPNPDIKGRRGTSKFDINDVLNFHNKKNEICFLCLRRRNQLGNKETFTLDHIEELSHSGKDELGNLQILCSACHKLKNWVRLYLNWHINGDEKQDDT